MNPTMPPIAYELGIPTAEYTSKRGRLIWTIIGVLFLFALSGFFFFGALSAREPIGLFIMGLLCGGLGLALVVGTALNWNTRVLVFPDGLVHIKNGKSSVFRWNDIGAVWQQITKRYVNGVYTGTTHFYTLRRYDGEQIKLNDSLGKVEELGNLVQSETFKRLMPKAIATYNAGGTVVFGKISVSPQGISNGKETLPWTEVKGVTIDRGVISVSKQGKWLRWASDTAANTPNLYVFLQLVDAIIGIKTK
jgi:hypothetical protein